MNGIILVGVDNSDTAFKAAQRAASLASGLGYELHVLAAYDTSDVSPPSISHTRSKSHISAEINAHDDALTRQVNSAQSTAQNVTEKLRAEFPGLSIEPIHAEGNPAAAIIRAADDLKADIVVVGNKRVQSPTRVLGTIAGAVAKEVKCDVYIANTHHQR